jgi:hypothetical protein
VPLLKTETAGGWSRRRRQLGALRSRSYRPFSRRRCRS